MKNSQNKRKILIHLHRPPIPINGGDKNRLVGFLKYFKERKEFFEVDAFGGNTFGQNEWDTEQKQTVLEFVNNFSIYQGGSNIVDFLYSRSQSFYYQRLLRQQLPIDSDYFAPLGYIKFVQNLLLHQNYDFIWINYIHYAHLGINLGAKRTKAIIDIHDLGCQGRLVLKSIPYLKRLKFDYEANLIREAKLLDKYDTVIVNSEDEFEILNSSPHIKSHKLWLIPHLIEQEFRQFSILPPYQERRFEYDLLFVGTSRIPNLDAIHFFLASIFPTLVYKKPNIQLALAGTVAEAAQFDAIFSKNIKRIGYVSDLSEIYLKSRLVICPLLDGAGTKVKLQEALAYAVPIVTTTVGASGMKLIDSINAFITNEPELFAHQILLLLEQPQIAQQLSQSAAMTYKKHYSSSVVHSKLDQLFDICSF